VLVRSSCCSLPSLRLKIEAALGTSAGLSSPSPFRFYNANVETLMESNAMGGSGFSGISANFYPWLHVHLCSKDVDEVDKAKIQRFLSVAEVHTAAAARVLPRAHSPPLICPALIHLPCSAPRSFTSPALPRTHSPLLLCPALRSWCAMHTQNQPKRTLLSHYLHVLSFALLLLMILAPAQLTHDAASGILLCTTNFL
jgi:hypothetical protein